MARMYPDSTKTRVIFSSSAEEQFYQQAIATLPDSWRVYHSCTLSVMEEKEGLKDNEIDFVCYHPDYGVVVVEVKGGRIRHDIATGQYASINRLGESFAIKDPFQQVLVWKSRFLRYLRHHQVKVPVSHAVALPAVAEDEFPTQARVNGDIIIGRNRIKDLETTLKQIALKSQPEQYLKFQDVSESLDKLLVGATFTTRLFLRDYLDAHETRVKDVESIQEALITPIASSLRLGIEGEAGTGKTMLALLLARHFRAQGQTVLLLSSNALLNLYLQRDVGAGVEAQTYQDLASTFGVNLLIPPQDYAGEKADWVQYEAPERLKKAVAQATMRYDVVLCDEAQDVQPFWWEAIESLLASAERSRFYLFFDRSQGVFGAGEETQFRPEDMLPIKAPYFPLVHNYRTTREIASFSRSFRTNTGVLQSHCGRLGYVPELVVYKDAADAQRLLARLVRQLTREEGLHSEEVTLISARNPAARESVLYNIEEVAKMPLHRLQHQKAKTWKEARTPRGSLPITTIAGFKGMETPVGILMNVSEYNLPVENPIMASLIYVACTRAKHMLYVFVKEGDPKLEAFKKALSTLKAAGTLVIEGSRSDYQFCGTVAHYNPERVGWLTVEDPAFQHGSVMFFPHDVRRADLGELKVGMKIKFRPRIEGHATIASDLILTASA